MINYFKMRFIVDVLGLLLAYPPLFTALLSPLYQGFRSSNYEVVLQISLNC